jgi:fatty-acyl-CoA synthase
VSILYERVRAQVMARPGATALQAGEKAWTYAEFDAEIGRWNVWLAQQGLERGMAFGWLGLNSVAQLAALWACAQRGVRFVPLNWRLAGPELVALAHHAGLAAWHADEAFDALQGVTPRPQPPDRRHDDLLLAYTSGTTGEPKGALHTQAAMVANIDAAIDAQGLDGSTRALAVLPLFHVGGLCIQVLPTLAAGGSVCLHPRFDATAWLNEVETWWPTTSLLVPATMRALVEHPRWPQADLRSLAFVNSGSSIVPRAFIDAFHARGVPVCQVFGSTETGPVTLVLRPDEALAHPGSTGRPARGAQVRLVDGEVQVRAPQLARGYHRIDDDPAFAGGWFRTGDLARVDADGFYEIVGRSKDMIISGGENVYPAEIEHLALTDPAVAEAAAFGLPDARWGEVAVLAVVPRAGHVIDTGRLQALFAERLARFKHPRRIVVLDALPKTALGKVRKADLALDLRQRAGP